MRRVSLMLVGFACLLAFQTNTDAQGKKKKAPLVSDHKDRFGDPLPVGAIARIGTVRYRVSPFASPDRGKLSPDGKHFAAIGNQNEILMWDLPAWTKRRFVARKMADKTPRFDGIAFTPVNGQVIGYDVDQHRLVFFDLATLKLVKTLSLKPFTPDEKIQLINPHLHVAPDAKTIVLTGQAQVGPGPMHEIHLWDLAKDAHRHVFRIPMDRNGGDPKLAVSAAARRMARSVEDRNPNAVNPPNGHFIEVYDLETGKRIHDIDTGIRIQHLAISSDGKWLAASNDGAVLRIYNAGTGKERHHIRLRRASGDHLAFSPDGSELYLATSRGTISRFNVATGDLIATHDAPTVEPVRHFGFRDGKAFALAVGLESLIYWEVATGKLLSPADVPTGFIREVAFTANDELFVASEDGMMGWWDPRTGERRRKLRVETPDGIEDFLRADLRDMSPLPIDFVGLSPDGAHLGVGWQQNLSLYSAKTGKLLYDDGPFLNGPMAVAFLEHGKKMVSVSGKIARVWNTATGRDHVRVKLPLREQETVTKMAGDSAGRFLVFATMMNEGIGRVFLWDLPAGKMVHEWLGADRLEGMRFSPDDRWLAVAFQNQIKLVRMASPRGEYVIPLDDPDFDVTQVTFSPDGRQLAVAAIVPTRNGGDAGRIWIFELASKKLRLQLMGHADGIIDHLAYSADSALLASGATDTNVLVWNAGLSAFTAEPELKEDLTASVKELANLDARIAFQHMIKLARSPKQAVKLLSEKITPTEKPGTGGRTIAQWVRDLSSNQFIVRSRAADMLRKLGPLAEAELSAMLQKTSDVETRRRIEELLERIASPVWTPTEVEHARAVEVLAALKTPEARTLLARWADGDPGAVLTQEAIKTTKHTNDTKKKN